MNFAAELATYSIRLMVNLLLLGAPVAVAVAVAFRLTRMASPRARYWVAVLAFVIAATAPVATTLDVAQEPRPARALAINVRAAEIIHQSYETVALAPSDTSFPVAISLTERLNVLVGRLADSQFAIVFLALWINVSLLLIGRDVAGHVMLARARRSWQPAPMTLRQELGWPDAAPLYLDEHTGPSAVGLMHPAVVLPARLLGELSPATVQCIARHELAHVRWRDPLVNGLLRMARAALWPSLPLWFLARAICAEREAAADRAALESACSSSEASQTVADYAASLVSLALWSGGRDYSMTGTQLGSVAGLEHRVRRLLTAPARLTRARLFLSSVTLLAGVLGMAVLPAISQPFNSTSAALGQGRPDEADARPLGTTQNSIRNGGTSNVTNVTVRATDRVARRKATDLAVGAVSNAGDLTSAAAGLADQDSGGGARRAQKVAEATVQSRLRRSPLNHARAPANSAHAPVNYARASP